MNSSDPLAEFRAGRSIGPAAARPLEPYQAFQASERSRFMLWIRVNQRNKSSHVAPSYGYLQMVYSDGAGFFIGLRYAALPSVRIHGRNLQTLHQRILAHEVDWIQEFDPVRWRACGNGDPIVTAIEIRQDGGTA
jgi:hypothetical protein